MRSVTNGNNLKRWKKIFASASAVVFAICVMSICLTGCFFDRTENESKNDGVCNINIMSFNIRTTNENRGDRIKAVIARNDPDILGTQEVSKHWQPFMKSLDGYTCVGVGRDNGGSNSNDEAGYLLFKTDKFELSENDSGTCWFNPDPAKMNKPYTQRGSVYPRIFTYALLTRKSDLQELLVVNTHMPLHHNSRKKAADILVRWLEENYCGVPTYVTGDFNTDSDRGAGEGAYSYINPVKSGEGKNTDIDTKLMKAGFKNARLAAPSERTDDHPTFPTRLYASDWEGGANAYEKKRGHHRLLFYNRKYNCIKL